MHAIRRLIKWHILAGGFVLIPTLSPSLAGPFAGEMGSVQEPGAVASSVASAKPASEVRNRWSMSLAGTWAFQLDPNEATNLVDDPKFANLLKAMRAKLDDWKERAK